MADLRPEPWKGVLWFGFFAAMGLGVSWGIRRQIARGYTPKHSSPAQQQFAMIMVAVVGLVAALLAARELIRWLV